MVVLEKTRRRQPLLLLAAWASPVIPVVAVVLAFQWANAHPRDDHGAILAFGLACLACAGGFLSGIVGCLAVKTYSVWATIPAALLGLLLNLGTGLISFVFWGLAAAHRC